MSDVPDTIGEAIARTPRQVKVHVPDEEVPVVVEGVSSIACDDDNRLFLLAADHDIIAMWHPDWWAHVEFVR